MKDQKKPLRACLFRFLLLCLEKHRPQIFDCLVIRILMNTTAAAFRTDPVPVPVRPGGAAKALDTYASFTKHCLENLHLTQPADRERLFERLFHYSLALGRKVRALTGLTDSCDLQRLVFLLYRCIGIRMNGQLPGTVTVAECFFSRFYTPAQCALMSGMDSGITAGICGSGKLRFHQRITQGCAVCRAYTQR